MTHPFRKLSSWLKMGFKTPQLQVLAWGTVRFENGFQTFKVGIALPSDRKSHWKCALLAQLLLWFSQTLRDGFFFLLPCKSFTWCGFRSSLCLRPAQLSGVVNKHSSPTAAWIWWSCLTGRESKVWGIHGWGWQRKATSFLKLNKSSQRIWRLDLQSWGNVWRK